jgi:membrane-bound serine protease (ClpP class)
VPIKGYTIYAILTSLLWEAILVAVVLLLLPQFEVHIPLWALIVLMVVLGAYCAAMYWLGRSALEKAPVLSLKALVGTKCKTATTLSPRGYIRIRGELWQAKSESDAGIGAGKEVIVEGVEGMTLVVRLPGNNRSGKTR